MFVNCAALDHLSSSCAESPVVLVNISKSAFLRTTALANLSNPK